MKCEPTLTPADIDIPALREKYRQERDKRLRAEGSKQFIETSNDFAEYWETDPHSPPPTRAAIACDVEVVVLGGGFAGLIAAARLKEAGVSDVRVVEMGGDFGGVWYWNRYPGIQCDNDSYCYIPLLEELNYMPTKKFADGAEIFAHCQRIGRHFALYEGALFGTQARTMRWDEASKRWRIRTNREDDLRARFVVMASGPWNRPKLPGIPGIQSFKGHSFHSSRWDYAYTGGSTTDTRLDKLADKRVAIIGTGATAIQCVPHLARYAEHLYVFQRTPSSVDERGNAPTDSAWVRTLKPGWQKERQVNFHRWAFEAFSPAGQQDFICDFWTEITRNMAARLGAQDHAAWTIEQLIELREQTDHQVMERLRRRIDGIVKDKRTAEALKPYYRFLCKRPSHGSDRCSGAGHRNGRGVRRRARRHLAPLPRVGSELGGRSRAPLATGWARRGESFGRRVELSLVRQSARIRGGGIALSRLRHALGNTPRRWQRLRSDGRRDDELEHAGRGFELRSKAFSRAQLGRASAFRAAA
jgi:cyclohexanone monooxygenase